MGARARASSKKKYQALFAFHDTIEKRKRFGDVAVLDGTGRE